MERMSLKETNPLPWVDGGRENLEKWIGSRSPSLTPKSMSKVKVRGSNVVVNYPSDKYWGLPMKDIEAHTKQLEGRILTLIDATISDTQQNKAQKDIVRGHFRYKIQDMYTDSSLYETFGYNPKALALPAGDFPLPPGEIEI